MRTERVNQDRFDQLTADALLGYIVIEEIVDHRDGTYTVRYREKKGARR